MKAQVMKLGLAAAMVMGVMGVAQTAHAEGTTVTFVGSIAKTTCDVTPESGDGDSMVNIGQYLPADFVAGPGATKTNGHSVTLSFGNCQGEDVAANGEVKLTAQGAKAMGTNGLAFGDASTTLGWGIDLPYSQGAAPGATAITPTNNEISVYKNTGANAETVAALSSAITPVVITPELITFSASTDLVPAQLSVPVVFTVAYN